MVRHGATVFIDQSGFIPETRRTSEPNFSIKFLGGNRTVSRMKNLISALHYYICDDFLTRSRETSHVTVFAVSVVPLMILAVAVSRFVPLVAEISTISAVFTVHCNPPLSFPSPDKPLLPP